MKHIASIAIAVMIALLTPQASAQVTAELDIRNNTLGYTVIVTNNGPDPVSSVEYALNIGANFDTENSQGFPASPDVGINNDGMSSRTITWTPAQPLDTGDVMNVSGDIDGTLSSVDVTVNFTSGASRTGSLIVSNNVWSAVLQPVPTGPIINGTGTATLRWLAPTEYQNGTPIQPGDLKGYVIYWDTLSGIGRCSDPTVKLDPCYSNSLDLNDGGAITTPLTLTFNGDTTLFFAMTAYTENVDSDGNPATQVSNYSNETAKIFTVQTTDTTPDPASNPGAPVLQDVTVTIICTTNQANLECDFTVQ